MCKWFGLVDDIALTLSGIKLIRSLCFCLFWCFIWRSAHFGIRPQKRRRKVANKKSSRAQHHIRPKIFLRMMMGENANSRGVSVLRSAAAVVVMVATASTRKSAASWTGHMIAKQNKSVTVVSSAGYAAAVSLCRSILCQRQSQIVLHTRPR